MEDHLADIDGGAAGDDAPALLPDVRLLLFTPGAPPRFHAWLRPTVVTGPFVRRNRHLHLQSLQIAMQCSLLLINCQLFSGSVCCNTQCLRKELLNTA